MIGQLLIGLALLATTVVIHGAGLMFLSRWRRTEEYDPNSVSPTDLLDLANALITVMARLSRLRAVNITINPSMLCQKAQSMKDPSCPSQKQDNRYFIGSALLECCQA